MPLVPKYMSNSYDITILKLKRVISDGMWPHGVPPPSLLPSFSFMPNMAVVKISKQIII